MNLFLSMMSLTYCELSINLCPVKLFTLVNRCFFVLKVVIIILVYGYYLFEF